MHVLSMVLRLFALLCCVVMLHKATLLLCVLRQRATSGFASSYAGVQNAPGVWLSVSHSGCDNINVPHVPT